MREEFAPYGYLKAADVLFMVEDTGKVQSVVMKDEMPTGTIIINKDGEFLTETNLVKDQWYSFIFDYFRKSLAGVTFEVYAAEDIMSPDGLDTVYFEKDELVDTIVTNDKGIAMIANLPLGRYYLVESKTLEGFVLDSTPQSILIKEGSEGQQLTFYNKRVGGLELIKVSASDETKRIPNTTFEIRKMDGALVETVTRLILSPRRESTGFPSCSTTARIPPWASTPLIIRDMCTSRTSPRRAASTCGSWRTRATSRTPK